MGTTTIHRYLRRAGVVTPQPQKRPRSSYVRFEADQPNEMWQADFTHYPLTTGTDSEILSWLDDHARYALSITAHVRVTGPIVVDTFLDAVSRHGTPASTLTDNGMVFTTRLAGGRGGRNAFEATLVRLGVTQKNSRPNHPTTCGKVERFQQTLKAWLRAQPPAGHHRRAPSPPRRVRRALQPPATPPITAPPRSTRRGLHPRPKATPGDRTGDTHYRVRHDRVDKTGRVTLRHARPPPPHRPRPEHARTRVVMLIADLDVRVIDAATGELLRHLTLDPNRDYQPLGRPPDPHPETTTTRTQMKVRAVRDVLGHHIEPRKGIEPLTYALRVRCSAD